MLTEMDRVRLDVCIGSIRGSVQKIIGGMFDEHKKDFSELVDRTIDNFDWEGEITKQINIELQRHARIFTENSMRCVSNDFDSYAAVQKECDELVRMRLTELYLKEKGGK